MVYSLGMSYFNTTHLTGADLKKAWLTAETQEQKALVLFLKYPDQHFSPFDVQLKVFGNRVPITSVRRALTNLTDEGRLVKTSIQQPGPYGKPSHTWRLNHDHHHEG